METMKEPKELETPAQFTSRYMNEVLPLFEEYKTPLFTKAMQILEKAYQNQNTIFICGNGGSAGTSNHMVNDLSKGSINEGRLRLRVIGLADNMSLLTAYANDCGYETIFVEQLKSLWRPGDVLIAISASGNSENVVRAADYAVQNKGSLISLVGFTGGKLKAMPGCHIHFGSHNYGAVEDAQLMFSHLASQYMHQYIRAKGPEIKFP